VARPSTIYQALSDSMGRFAWKNMIAAYDQEFENLF